MLLERRVFFLFSHVRGSTSSSSLRQSLRRTRLRDYSFSSHTWGARDGTAFCDSATIAYQSASPGRLAIRPKVPHCRVESCEPLAKLWSWLWSQGLGGGTRERCRSPGEASYCHLRGRAGARGCIESRSACSARCARGEQPTHRRLDAVEPSTRSSLARSGRLRAALRSAICQSKWAAQDLQPSCCCFRAPARRSA